MPSIYFKIYNKIKKKPASVRERKTNVYFNLALPTISYLYRTWIGYMYRKKNQTSGAMYP